MVGRSIKGLLLIGLGGMFCGLVKKFQEQQLHFLFDERSLVSSLSSESITSLQQFFIEQRTTFSTPALCAQAIEKQFSFIKKVTIHAVYPYGTYRVTLQPALAQALLNEQYVLSDQGKVVDRYAWRQDTVQPVPSYTIACNDLQALCQECKDFLKNIDPQIYKHYSIEWVDASLIKFHDKTYPRITILGCASTAQQILLDSDYQKMRDLVVKEKCANVKGRKNWCIDTRFKNQMIVFEGGTS